MLILIGILPATYALNMGSSPEAIQSIANSAQTISSQMDRLAPGVAMAGYQAANDELSAYLKDHRPNLALPVSTTHVLSSGIAGTMAANRSGLQKDTLRNILLAWVLTLPVSVLLGAGIFAFGLNIVLKLGI